MPLPYGSTMLANATTDRDPMWPFVKFLMLPRGPDSATVFVDQSPSKRVITANANAKTKQQDAGGLFGGGALYLDGAGDCLTMPDSTDWFPVSDEKWTWEMWLRPEGTYSGAARFVLGQAVGTGFTPIIVRRDTGDRVQVDAYRASSVNLGPLGPAAATAMPSDAWTFVAVDYDTVAFRLYMGTFAGCVQVASASPVSEALYDAIAPMTIGAYSYDDSVGTPTRQWKGWVGPTRFTRGFRRSRYPDGKPFIPPTVFPTR